LKVSVITVVYNNASTIKSALDSVVAQTYKNIEYVVIDGGSTDGTYEILKEYYSAGKINILISEKDRGIYDAMNKGIVNCTGEIIGILNSDDIYASSDVIQKVADKFKSTQCEGLYGDLVYVKQDDVSKVVRYWKSGKFKANQFLNGWMPPHPTFFVLKSVYQNYGVFDTRLRISADYELMLRLIHRHKIKVSYLSEVLVQMRTGGASNKMVKSRIRANYEDRISWRINNIHPRFYTLTAKPLLKIRQFLLLPKGLKLST
jgi:glycosyltransferase involved in cell wall biosynthesis